jgi:hypothetical protein
MRIRFIIAPESLSLHEDPLYYELERHTAPWFSSAGLLEKEQSYIKEDELPGLASESPLKTCDKTISFPQSWLKTRKVCPVLVVSM